MGNGAAVGQRIVMKGMMKNVGSNFAKGSGACPFVGEFKEVGEGIAKGDFGRVALNGGVLGLSGVVGLGSVKVAGQAYGRSMLPAATLCMTNSGLRSSSFFRSPISQKQLLIKDNKSIRKMSGTADSMSNWCSRTVAEVATQHKDSTLALLIDQNWLDVSAPSVFHGFDKEA